MWDTKPRALSHGHHLSMKKPWLFRASLPLALMAGALPALGQGGGDQFLDGIGETALVARYVFDGNERDSSRNARDATLHGSRAAYVEDAQFGRVLSLPGGEGAYVQIPGAVPDGLDTISVVGWIQIKQAGAGSFFDFGLNPDTHFFCVNVPDGFRAGITRDGLAGARSAVTSPIPPNQWMHLGVVLDASRRTMTCYLDGVKVAQASGLNLTLEQVLKENGNVNRVFIGRSQQDSEPRLSALIHDFRIYSVALTDEQVAVIRANALTGGDSDLVAPSSPPAQPIPMRRGIAQPMASRLTGVENVAVETARGCLPRLPYWVPGVYRGNVKGPDVRVIWPAPVDNRQALTSDVYIVVGRVPGTDFQANATVTVKASDSVALPRRQLEAFPLGSVTLLQDARQRDTPFIKNRDKFLRELAQTNPDRFLYMFRNAFGQPQPPGIEPLGVWDNQTTRLRGHATGHYLSAIAQAHASTPYDEALHANFRRKMDYLIDTLYELSRKSGTPTNAGAPFVADPTAIPPRPGKTRFDSDLSEQGIRTDYWNWGKGFMSAYPPDQFIMLEQGAVYGGNNDQIWAPYYTLHKILAGLLDCYEVGRNEKALVIAEDMARWVNQRLDAVPAATRISMWNRYIAGEYGGMNEVLARLGRITGEDRFLECAKLFDNVNFFFGDAQRSHGLARNVDTIRGKHANQHIPQIIGALETYRNTHERDYWFVAENFWEICTHSYAYSIGGVAGARKPNNAECFTAQPDSLFTHGFSNGGQNETCATYNLLKLSRQLFMFNPDARYMDYYEQALYNHILASVAGNDAGNTYHVPLNPAARKQFSNARMDGFTCCNGTAIESHTKLQDSIYFRSADNRTLYVNLFVPSKLIWSDRGVTLTQQTEFPHDDTTKLMLSGGGRFELKVRVPYWATRGFTVRINGQTQDLAAKPESYLTLSRAWEDGDTIELEMPLGFHLLPVMDQPNLASLFYGPVLLAAQESEPRSTWRPTTLNGEELGQSISGDPRTLRFKTGGTIFQPFYETYGRHSVYLDVTME